MVYDENNFAVWTLDKLREGRVKLLTPREAGYAIQLSNKPLLDVRPSSERNKVVDSCFELFHHCCCKELIHLSMASS